eukprot:6175218-Amphidinium_carterae.1
MSPGLCQAKTHSNTTTTLSYHQTQKQKTQDIWRPATVEAKDDFSNNHSSRSKLNCESLTLGHLLPGIPCSGLPNCPSPASLFHRLLSPAKSRPYRPHPQKQQKKTNVCQRLRIEERSRQHLSCNPPPFAGVVL